MKFKSRYIHYNPVIRSYQEVHQTHTNRQIDRGTKKYTEARMTFPNILHRKKDDQGIFEKKGGITRSEGAEDEEREEEEIEMRNRRRKGGKEITIQNK